MVSVGFCNDTLTGAVLHYGESLPVENPSYPKGDLDNDGKIDHQRHLRRNGLRGV